MAAKDLRDDFPATVKRDLCDRVGAMCSRPDCCILTKGPKASSPKATNIGRASHIHAASPGGPRFDPGQTSKERKAFDNGIWLCANHAAEIDDDHHSYDANTLRGWKLEAEERARRLLGRSVIASGANARAGLISIGPGVIIYGQVVRNSPCQWTIAVERFILGDVSILRRFADEFAALNQEDCFVCVETEGIGRVLTEGPEIDLTSGLLVELRVAAPLPVAEARELFDVHKRGSDIPIDMTGDEPDLDLSGRTVSGSETIAQTLLVHLSCCKGGYKVGAETGSRVAEFRERLGADLTASIVAIETIRLATVTYQDDFLKRGYAVLDFVERVRDVRVLPTTSTEYIKVGIVLDVHGLAEPMEFIVPISTSTEELGPPPPWPSFAP